MSDNNPGIKKHRMVIEEIEIPVKPNENEQVRVENKPDILETGEKDTSLNKENENRNEDLNNYKATKESSPVLWILVPGIFLLGAILGGIIFYQRGVNLNTDKNSPTPEATINANPTSTPVASVDLSKYEISVFNGSGIAGEAGTVKGILDNAGFTVVSTANASTYDYTNTVIKAKASVDSAFLQKLRDTLSKTYTLDANQSLSSTSTTDIQIIVGSSKAE